MKRIILVAVLVSSASALGAGPFSDSLEVEISMIRLAPLNYFLFMIPPLAWNAAFASRLDMGAFPGTAPPWYETLEWIFRAGALLYPALISIDAKNGRFIPGLAAYSIGLLAYFASWLPYMSGPVPHWAEQPFLRFASVYLPALWLGGVSFMSGSWIHAGLVIAFLGLHIGEYAIRWAH